MNSWLFVLDIISVLLTFAGFFFAYKLWAILGKHGVTVWLLCAMVWAIFLRMISIFHDIGLTWVWLNYSRQLAFPLYLFLLIGLYGLFSQVRRSIITIVDRKLPAVPEIKEVVVHLNAVEVITPAAIVKIPGKTITLPVNGEIKKK